MTVQTLLVELFVEELPPKALKKLGEAFTGTLFEQLRAQGLTTPDADATPFASPRRLAAQVAGVLAAAPERAVSHKLMPAAVGLDASGNATPALLKKLGALGADAAAVSTLKRQHDDKADILFLDTVQPGATLAAGLQTALDEAIAKLPIPKVMTYQLADGWTSVKFVRPAHGLVALHGADVVPVQALGLTAGRDTHGHRFEAAADPVAIPDAAHYATVLEQQGAVIASFAARKAAIHRQLHEAAHAAGDGLKPIEDDALLDEVTALVERPHVVTCRFEERFLAVPQECLILTMKANQKYFPLLKADGQLSNVFLVVSNIRPADASAVVQGNERVVRPRLADAEFFFNQDRKKRLEERVPALAKVVYHNQLGSQGERIGRVVAIAEALAARLGDAALLQQARQAAQLAKADLVTDMVGEFPELQGTMGRYYAQHDGLPADVADAIEDHYKPRFAGDTLPQSQVGTVVALADKLETLAGLFGIGNLPTGEKDPFALRRHALGVLRLVAEQSLPLTVNDLLDAAFPAFGALLQPEQVATAREALTTFLQARFDGWLVEQGFDAQQAQSVQPLFAGTPLAAMPQRLEAVRAFAALPEAPSLAAANKRIANILKKAGAVDAHANPSLFTEPAEHALHAEMQRVLPQADAQYQAGDYTASLATLAALRAPVDAFFDGVMVNAEQADVRLNRLGLLQQLHRAMNRVADLSRLAA